MSGVWTPVEGAEGLFQRSVDGRFEIHEDAKNHPSKPYELRDHGESAGWFQSITGAELEATLRLMNPERPKAASEIPQPDAHDPQLDFEDVAWRVDQYVLRGYSFEVAEHLALLRDEDGNPLDWHRVAYCLDNGATPELVEKILT